MRCLILPSPLLGPATYQALADELGAEVAEVRGRSVDAVLTGFVDQADDFDVLVPHSNAGRFAPAVAEEIHAAVVYVDALLPEAEEDPEITCFLRGLADDDGVLPGWTDWWPSEEIDDLLGSWRSRVEAEQGRWPLEFMLSHPPLPESWQARRAGYLAFGDTYAAESARAASNGWPVTRMEGHHLQFLHHPAEVAGEVRALAEQLTIHPPAP